MTPLVLLPGMMCDARIFTPQIDYFSGFRTVVVAPMTTSGSFSTLAKDILANAPPQFALAGLSMGGIAAMEIIRQAPDRVTKLALLDTNPRAETDERKKQREPQIANVLAGNLETVMRDEMKPHYLSDAADNEPLLNLCMDMAITLGPDVFVNQSRALQFRPDQTSTLSSVRVPALVLCGEDDRLCPVTTHEEMQRIIPSATLAVIAGAGHMPTLEQPEKTNAALEGWLNR